MSGEFINEAFPRGPLLGAASLVLLTLSAVGIARLAGPMHLAAQPRTQATASVVFTDREDGAVIASDAASGQELLTVAPGTGGFFRATLRALARERRSSDIGSRAPFVIRRLADGRLELEDSATGRIVQLAAFGPTNAQSFAALLPPQEPPR
jgi:putative photosynthetic complex assembly protein